MDCHPTSTLLAAVPVSIRPEGNTEMTNQVSMARMSLASTIKDPIERLHAIRESSGSVKALMNEMKTQLPTDFPSIGAPWMLSALANILARSRLANSMPAFANVVISNVPGPNVSLYFAGAKQISTFPVSIPYHGMALNITLQGYNGWLDFGLIGCRRAMPDIDNLAGYMQAAHEELLRRSRELVVPTPAKTPSKISVKTVKPAAKARKRAAAKKPAKAKARAK
jgi:hypothetical protein